VGFAKRFSLLLRHGKAMCYPALSPREILPVPAPLVNRWGLLWGYACRCAQEGLNGPKMSWGGRGASAQRLQQVAVGVRRAGGCWHCWSGSWGGSAWNIYTAGTEHPETCLGWLSKSQRGPGRGTPMWETLGKRLRTLRAGPCTQCRGASCAQL